MNPIDGDELQEVFREECACECACCRYGIFDKADFKGCKLIEDAPTIKEYAGMRLLIEWAEECHFGYDNFPEEYEKYKDEIEGMGYIEGMIYIATKEAEALGGKHGNPS